MDPEILRQLLDRRPFQPFRMMVTGGIWFEVRHHAMAALLRRTIEFGLPIEGGQQRFVTVSLIHVICVEVVRPLPNE